MLDGGQVAHLKPKVNEAVCQAPRHMVLTDGEGNDILSKLSGTCLHQMKHIHESAAPAWGRSPWLGCS
jgi:urease accessory protein UreF